MICIHPNLKSVSSSLDGDHSLVVEGDAEFCPLELSSHGPDEELALQPFQYHVALFLLKAKEERRISQRALDGVLCDVEELLRIKTSTVVAEIKRRLWTAQTAVQIPLVKF